MPNDPNLLKLAYLERIISGVSPTNQTHVREYVNERLAEGLKVTSLQQIAIGLRYVDWRTRAPGTAAPMGSIAGNARLERLDRFENACYHGARRVATCGNRAPLLPHDATLAHDVV